MGDLSDDDDDGATQSLLSRHRVHSSSSASLATASHPPAAAGGAASAAAGAGGGCCARFLESYPCLLFIVGNEFCERFSYYGLRTILLVYLSEELRLSDDDATGVYHAFVVACYFFPLLGGHIADTYWGKFKTIVVLSAVYCLGSALMSVTALSPVLDVVGLWGVCAALLLVAVGTGGIKPCVSAFGGDQYGPHQAAQQATFFSIFYFSINVGSMMSTIVTPIVKDRWSYAAAFALPAALLVAATLIFISGSSRYTKVAPVGQSVLGRVWNVVSQARRQQPGEAHKEAVTPPHAKTKPATRPASQYGGLPTAAAAGGGGGGWAVPHWTDRALGQPGVTDDDVQDVRQLLSVLWLMLPLPPFWTLYDQTGSRWTLQARRMDLLLFNGTLAGSGRVEIAVLPEQMQVVNAALILVFIPLFEGCVYPLLGMVLCGVAFVMAALLEIWIGTSDEGSISVLWQLPQYIVLTSAEILFSIQGLAFSYAQAPSSMKSVVSSAWLITVAVGNSLTIAVASVQFFQKQEHEFFFFAGLVAFFAAVFAFVTREYQYVEDRERND